jgi:hypothetical protein
MVESDTAQEGMPPIRLLVRTKEVSGVVVL